MSVRPTIQRITFLLIPLINQFIYFESRVKKY